MYVFIVKTPRKEIAMLSACYLFLMKVCTLTA